MNLLDQLPLREKKIHSVFFHTHNSAGGVYVVHVLDNFALHRLELQRPVLISLKMGAAKSRFKRKRSSVRKSVHSHKEEEEAGPKVILFTGSSHKMNLAFALPLAEESLSKFKVLVTMPSLSSSEYLADSRILNVLNKTLFVLQMDMESDESVRGVLREIMDNDGFIDAVGEFYHARVFNPRAAAEQCAALKNQMSYQSILISIIICM